MKRTRLRRRTPLRPVSAKRAAEQQVRRDLLAATSHGPVPCTVPWCPRPAVDAHEILTRARGGSITDPGNIAPLCRPCHDEITFTEPAWAYELGLLRHSWEGKTR